jgi:hypothetical protein
MALHAERSRPGFFQAAFVLSIFYRGFPSFLADLPQFGKPKAEGGALRRMAAIPPGSGTTVATKCRGGRFISFPARFSPHLQAGQDLLSLAKLE